MKLLASATIGGSSFVEPIPSDLYEAYVVAITGTSAVGQELFAQDIGTVRVLINGNDVINADYQDLLEFSRLHGGSVQAFSAGTNDVFEHYLVIPRGFRDGNVEQIVDRDRAQFTINYGPNVSTKVLSGTVELYGITRKTGTQLYYLKLLNINDTIGGATTKPIVYREENVIAIYPRLTVRNANTDETTLTRIQCEVDGKEVCNVAREALRFASYNRRNNDAGETTKLGEILIADDGNIGEYLSDDVTLRVVTSGALTFDSLVAAADFDPPKQRATAELSGEVIDMALRRKKKDGKTRPIQVVESALGIAAR